MVGLAFGEFVKKIAFPMNDTKDFYVLCFDLINEAIGVHKYFPYIRIFKLRNNPSTLRKLIKSSGFLDDGLHHLFRIIP